MWINGAAALAYVPVPGFERQGRGITLRLRPQPPSELGYELAAGDAKRPRIRHERDRRRRNVKGGALTG